MRNTLKAFAACLLSATLLCSTAEPARGATISLDFEEGAFGTNWFNLSSGADLVPNLGFSNAGEALQAGSWSLGPLPHGERDNPHDQLHVRSLAFQLDGSGDLTVDLKGGRGGAQAPDLGTGTISSNVLGVALTRASDGARVLSAASTFQGTITTVTWDQATLQPFADEAGETWTLDIYDTRTEGGWAWLSVDSISVPGVVPEPSTFALTALSLLGIARRRRKH